MPEITVNRMWTVQSVMGVCIQNQLYTKGDSEQYERMLDRVRNLYPSTENLYLIAKDIYEYSKEQTIANVMYLLEKDAVFRTFEIDGDDNA